MRTAQLLRDCREAILGFLPAPLPEHPALDRLVDRIDAELARLDYEQRRAEAAREQYEADQCEALADAGAVHVGTTDLF